MWVSAAYASGSRQMTKYAKQHSWLEIEEKRNEVDDWETKVRDLHDLKASLVHDKDHAQAKQRELKEIGKSFEKFVKDHEPWFE